MLVQPSISSPTRSAINELARTQERINSSMEALSTGKIVASGPESAGYIGRLSGLKSQMLSTLAASQNLGEAIALLDTADAALSEVADMLALIKETAVQASSAVITDTFRTSLTTEKDAIRNEIDSISSSTKFNGYRLLNGSLNGLKIQSGIDAEDFFSISLNSIATSTLGSHIVDGSSRSALAAAASATSNTTTSSEDIVLSSTLGSHTIDVAANDSAKAVVTKVNAISALTGISGSARTYAHLFSTNASSENYSLLINGTATSTFSVSSSDVSDAVIKINLISTTTGVTATATADNKVLISDSDGDDITIENESAGTSLDVQALQRDGATTQGSVISLATDDGNDATRVIGALRLFSDDSFSVSQSGDSSLGYLSSGSSTLNALSAIDFSSADSAADSLDVIDSALNQVAAVSAEVGAYQSRIDFKDSLLSRSYESRELARSNLEDADYALESARLAKALVLQAVNSSIIAQSNTNNDLILTLIA